MNRKFIIILLLVLPLLLPAQRKKFQLNGAARAYFFANNLDIDQSLDSITTRKANYGHTLLDLGVSLFPNDKTEVMGMFRIRNELGGFWGGGVSFDVRQLSLKGVAGGIVRYELGDIDLEMTPYTLHNFQEEGVVNEADVFALRRDVVYYDMFYQDNQWRMQGAQAEFGLDFNRVITGIDFEGFLTRQRMTNGADLPERLYGGGVVTFRRGENFSLGLNSVNIFDLKETIPDSIQYKNNVHTAVLRYSRPLADSIRLGLHSEAGISNARYLNYQDAAAPELQNEWFYDFALTGSLDRSGIEVKLGYKDIGADFLSPGAQTKRINYGRFPGLFQQITNSATGRPVSYIDFVSGATDNAYRISEQLLPYYAAYSNSNPYGTATPNRRGFYLEAERQDTSAFRYSFLRLASLSQSRGTGTVEKKKFLLLEAGTDLYLNDLFGMENDLKLDLGLRWEQTRRGGADYEKIALGSTLLDAGLTWEFVTNFDLMAGVKMMTASGNAFVNLRDRYNTIENFGIVDYDFNETTLASGLRYRFNDHNALSAQYQRFDIRHADESIADYGISQMTILYSLSF